MISGAPGRPRALCRSHFPCRRCHCRFPDSPSTCKYRRTVWSSWACAILCV